MEWKTSSAPVPYLDAITFMEERVRLIRAGEADEMVWLLEHPPLYTAGSSARAADLLSAGGFPVYKTGRGGEYTYHGPGQRVAYVMLDLKRRNPDIRWYIGALEAWIIAALKDVGIASGIREGRVGVWVEQRSGKEAKIAAIGVRIRSWVTYHGIAINVHPDLSHFEGIVPCGLKDFGVTSLASEGVDMTLEALDYYLRKQFNNAFQKIDL